MLEIYDEYADSSVQELVQTANLIEIYAESAMSLIENMEATEAFRNSYFTEASAEAETAAQETAKKNIFATIAESIAKIFSKLASLLSKGKTAAKAAKQGSDLKKIGPAVQKFPAVKIKIQDVWSYNKFVEDTIDKHIKKFDKKSTLGLFGKTFGTGKAIDALTKNLMLMASEMRTPSNKQFTINGKGASAGRKVAGAAGRAAVAAAVGGAIGKPALFDDNPSGLSNAGKAVTAAIMSQSGTMGKVIERGTKAARDVVVATPLLQNALVYIGAGGPLAIGTAAAIAGVFGIAAITRLFSNCPKKIGTEQITIQELYKRVSSLNPEKFPSEITSTIANVNKYMQQATTLSAFVESADGSKGATAYANKVSSLLSAYTNFHQSLIDFYLSIIVSILKAGGVTSSKKIYKPTEMVKTESTENLESENDDENVEDYAESVDDMDDYMDLDSFVENELTDMAY